MQKKLNISLVFITQYYFSVPKLNSRLNSIHQLIIKTHDKRESQNVAINHSAYIDYKDLMKIHGKCTREPYSFMTFDTTLPANNSLRFTKNLIDSL